MTGFDLPWYSAGFIDTFSSGSLDTSIWGTSIAGSGSVVETTSLTLTFPSTATDAAIAYKKVAIPYGATKTVEIDYDFTVGANPGCQILAVFQRATAPSVNTSANVNAYATSGFRFFFSSTQDNSTQSAWQAYDQTGTFNNVSNLVVLPIAATRRIVVYDFTPTTIRIRTLSGDRATTIFDCTLTLGGSGSTGLYDDGTNPWWITLGEPMSDAWQGTMKVYSYSDI